MATKQNCFQKELAAKQKEMSRQKADRTRFSNAIAKLTKISAIQATLLQLEFVVGEYEIYGTSYWSKNKSTFYWKAKHKGEKIGCGPDGCAVPKPVDKAAVLKEIREKLKK